MWFGASCKHCYLACIGIVQGFKVNKIVEPTPEMWICRFDNDTLGVEANYSGYIYGLVTQC